MDWARKTSPLMIKRFLTTGGKRPKEEGGLYAFCTGRGRSKGPRRAGCGPRCRGPAERGALGEVASARPAVPAGDPRPRRIPGGETTVSSAPFPALARPHRLVLLLSDLHLGRGTPAQTRAVERDAVALLRAHEQEIVPGPHGPSGGSGTLVLLGDVFEQYIEYRHLVPKGGTRLVGLLADWADRGAEIVYVVGNRDPWHVDFFEEEIGATLVRGVWEAEREGLALYIAHGDGRRPAERLSLRLQPLLRAPLMARLYRMGLPGDSGYALARWVSLRFGTDGTPDPVAVSDLAAEARRCLRTSGADVVAFGHSHRAALQTTDDGTYLNPGYWFGERTFARIDAEGPALLRWRDGRAVPLAASTNAPSGAALSL